jgi:hypothetical protein
MDLISFSARSLVNAVFPTGGSISLPPLVTLGWCGRHVGNDDSEGHVEFLFLGTYLNADYD